MILQPPTGNDNGALAAWARRLVDDLSRFFTPIRELPTFANDAAAAAGQLKVGEAYVDTSGIVRRRVA